MFRSRCVYSPFSGRKNRTLRSRNRLRPNCRALIPQSAPGAVKTDSLIASER